MHVSVCKHAALRAHRLPPAAHVLVRKRTAAGPAAVACRRALVFAAAVVVNTARGRALEADALGLEPLSDDLAHAWLTQLGEWLRENGADATTLEHEQSGQLRDDVAEP